MINTSEEKSRAKSAKDTDARTKRRAAQAQIVAGLQSILEADEQLLGFTRGIIAGGLRGKLTVGFEALFAPYVNVGLTERRVVLQHVQPESGKLNEILPHSFPLSDMHSITFSDIETFGGEPAGRLSLRLFNDQHFRLRFRDAEYVDNAKTVADVFTSLTASRPRARTSPTQSVCPHCDQILDRTTRFCPYCGHGLDSASLVKVEHSPADGSAAETGDTDESALSASDVSTDGSAGIVAAETIGSPEEAGHAAESSESGAENAVTTPAADWTNEPSPEPVATAPAAVGDAPEPEAFAGAPWAVTDAPAAETGAEAPAADMPTEGHEAPEPAGDPRPRKPKGDRAI